jgi:hypothetical protein
VIKSQARVKAREEGQKYYVPESPCARGHMLRRATSGVCIDCARLRETVRIDLDRITYNTRKQKERQHRLPQIAAKARVSRLMESDENKSIRREKSRLRSIIWRQKNPDHENTKLCKKTYRDNNPALLQALAVKRRVSKLNRTPKWTTKEDLDAIKHIYIIANQFSKSFGTEYHVDHIIPLQGKLVSGLHVPSNLQIIPAIDNIKKGNKYEVVT